MAYVLKRRTGSYVKTAGSYNGSGLMVLTCAVCMTTPIVLCHNGSLPIDAILMQITPTHCPYLSRNTDYSMKSRFPGVEWHAGPIRLVFTTAAEVWRKSRTSTKYNIINWSFLIDWRQNMQRTKYAQQNTDSSNHCDLHWHIVLLQEAH